MGNGKKGGRGKERKVKETQLCSAYFHHCVISKSLYTVVFLLKKLECYFLCISGIGRHFHGVVSSNAISSRVEVYNMQNKSVCVARINLNLLKMSCNPINIFIH